MKMNKIVCFFLQNFFGLPTVVGNNGKRSALLHRITAVEGTNGASVHSVGVGERSGKG